jgi:hypothetical protein
MAKKQRKKLPKLEEIKKKIKGKVYVGDEMKKRELRIKGLEKQVDSLSKQKDSLQTENDSLKQVIKIRVK